MTAEASQYLASVQLRSKEIFRSKISKLLDSNGRVRDLSLNQTDSMKKENVDKTLFDRLKRCFSLSIEKWDLNVYKRTPKTSGRGY